MSSWLDAISQCRLLVLQQKLERGEVPDIKELLGTVKCAVTALSNLEGGNVSR